MQERHSSQALVENVPTAFWESSAAWLPCLIGTVESASQMESYPLLAWTTELVRAFHLMQRSLILIDLILGPAKLESLNLDVASQKSRKAIISAIPQHV